MGAQMDVARDFSSASATKAFMGNNVSTRTFATMCTALPPEVVVWLTRRLARVPVAAIQASLAGIVKLLRLLGPFCHACHGRVLLLVVVVQAPYHSEPSSSRALRLRPGAR